MTVADSERNGHVDQYIPTGEQYRWHVDPQRPGYWRRRLVAAELFVDFMSYSSDEGSQLLACLSFTSTLPLHDLVLRLRNAWILVAYHYPTFSTRLSGPHDDLADGHRYIEYPEVTCLAEAEKRASRTFFAHQDSHTTAESLRAALSGTKLTPAEGETDSHLHAVLSPSSSAHALLLHTKHAMNDTISVCWLLGKVLAYAARSPASVREELVALDWQRASHNLPPHHLDPEVWEPDAAGLDVADVDDGLNRVFGHYERVGGNQHGLPLPPPALSQRLAPSETQTRRILKTFDGPTNARLLSACTKVGLTLGIVIQSALALALARQHPPADGQAAQQLYHLQAASVVSLRGLLKKPYNEASYQTSVLHSLPTSVPLSLAASSGDAVLPTICAFGEHLKAQWQDYRQWKGLVPSVHHYDCMVKRMWEASPPTPSHAGPQFSSVGRLDALVPDSITVEGAEAQTIEVDDFFVSLRLTSPATFLHVWGLGGTTTAQLMYNSFFWTGEEGRATLQALMDELESLLAQFAEEAQATQEPTAAIHAAANGNGRAANGATH